jgi:hypothetical protein
MSRSHPSYFGWYCSSRFQADLDHESVSLDQVACETPIDDTTVMDTDAKEVVAQPGLRVSVTDRGPGIPAGDRERVFRKFHKCVDQEAQRG